MINNKDHKSRERKEAEALIMHTVIIMMLVAVHVSCIHIRYFACYF